MNFKKHILLPFLLTRAALWAAGMFALLRNPAAAPATEHFHFTHPLNPFLEMWTRWDAHWYLAIAEKGYKISEAVQQNYDIIHSAGFFPLYPLCIRLLTLITQNTAASAIFISNASLLMFLFLLWKIISVEKSEETASRAVLLYLVFPSSFFLSSAYADSLFLCLTIASFYCARTNKWPAASALGFFSALTKPAGALVFIPLLIEFLLQNENHADKKTFLRAAPLFFIPCGTLLYMSFCFAQFNDPFAFFKWHELVRGAMGAPWKAFSLYLSWYPSILAWNNASKDCLFALLFVVLFFYGIRKTRASYSVFTGLHLYLLLSTTVISFMRLSLVFFPCFILMSMRIKNRFAYYGAALFSFVLMLFFMTRYATWDWVG